MEYKNKENVIEWITGEHSVSVSYTDPKFIRRITQIYEERPNEFKHFTVNDDGSIYAIFPKKWIKNNPGSLPNPDKPKRVMSEEQKAKLLAGLAKAREEKKKNTKDVY